MPGIHERNSRPPILFSIAKSDNNLSKTPLPATIVFSFNREILEKFLLNFNNNIYSKYFKNQVIEFTDNLSIKFLDNKDSFSEDDWNELYKLSEDTFVEESDSLKHGGAGAGLTDND